MSTPPLKASSSLPENYSLRVRLSIKDRRVLFLMNLMGLVLLVFFAWFFTVVAMWLRPDQVALQFSLNISGWGQILAVIGIVLVLTFGVLVLHEGIHGLGFLLLAGVRPVFAFKGVYAYAAAPGCYIPRNTYLAIGLAPLVLISLAAVVLMAVVPEGLIFAVILAAVLNAAGSVGDLWVAALLIRQPVGALGLDHGDEISIYAVER